MYVILVSGLVLTVPAIFVLCLLHWQGCDLLPSTYVMFGRGWTRKTIGRLLTKIQLQCRYVLKTKVHKQSFTLNIFNVKKF